MASRKASLIMLIIFLFLTLAGAVTGYDPLFHAIHDRSMFVWSWITDLIY